MKNVFYALAGLLFIIGGPISSIVVTFFVWWPNNLQDLFFPIKLIIAVVFCFIWNLVIGGLSFGMVMIGNAIGD